MLTPTSRKVILSPYPPRYLSAAAVICAVIFFGICFGNAVAAVLDQVKL